MIPKIIHYVWLGEPNTLSDDVEKCINTWKQFLPDYKFVLWNENNFDFSQSSYALEAYREKKYAFASDYIRLWALYHFGGIYLDTDVEVLKSFDSLLNNDAFVGFEDTRHVATCIIGSVKGNPILKEIMDDYQDRKFILGDGQYDMTPNPRLITIRLLRHGLVLDGSYQKLDLISVFPMEYFCPFNPYRQGKDCFTENTFANHHFNGSWIGIVTEKEKVYNNRLNKYQRIFGATIGTKLCWHFSGILSSGIRYWCKRCLNKLLDKWIEVVHH